MIIDAPWEHTSFLYALPVGPFYSSRVQKAYSDIFRKVTQWTAPTCTKEVLKPTKEISQNGTEHNIWKALVLYGSLRLGVETLCACERAAINNILTTLRNIVSGSGAWKPFLVYQNNTSGQFSVGKNRWRSRKLELLRSPKYLSHCYEMWRKQVRLLSRIQKICWPRQKCGLLLGGTRMIKLPCWGVYTWYM